MSEVDCPSASSELLMQLIHDADDEVAFAAFVADNAAMVLGTALRVVGDRGTAEEVRQDAFLTVWRERARFDPSRGSAQGWLRTITRRRALDVSYRRRPLVVAQDGSQRSAPEDPPDVAVCRSEESDELHALVAALPTDQRRAIELLFFAELDPGEVAERLGVPVSTVRGRARLGLERLERRLDPLSRGRSLTPAAG